MCCYAVVLLHLPDHYALLIPLLVGVLLYARMLRGAILRLSLGSRRPPRSLVSFASFRGCVCLHVFFSSFTSFRFHRDFFLVMACACVRERVRWSGRSACA